MSADRFPAPHPAQPPADDDAAHAPSASGTSGVVVGAIWAQSPSGVIGVDGGIPWHLSEDLKFFARTTIGHPVVMGLAARGSPSRRSSVRCRDGRTS